LEASASVASALAHLHSLSPPIAHGNVSLDSILFDAGGNAFLAGFGKARVVADGDAAPLAEDVRAFGVLMRDAFDGSRPRWLRRLLGRMLAADPAARPSAAEVANALSSSAGPSRPFYSRGAGPSRPAAPPRTASPAPA
jgi:serine/threonine protein kinase